MDPKDKWRNFWQDVAEDWEGNIIGAVFIILGAIIFIQLAW